MNILSTNPKVHFQPCHLYWDRSTHSLNVKIVYIISLPYRVKRLSQVYERFKVFNEDRTVDNGQLSCLSGYSIHRIVNTPSFTGPR